MIGFRTGAFAFRRLLFYLVAATDLAVRLLVGSSGWDSVSVVEGSGGKLSSIGVDTVVSMPVVAITVVLSIAAFLIAQASIRAATYLRLCSATLLGGSLLIYGVNPGMSAFGALLAYLILASGRFEDDAVFETSR